MVLEPQVKVSVCVEPIVFIRAADSEGKQAVKVERVCGMGLSESNDGVAVLVIFLIELAQNAPRFTVISALLNLCLQTENGFLRLVIVNKLLRMLHSIESAR